MAESDAKKTDFSARRTGFVFQTYNLLSVQSSIENVELPLLVSGMPAREARGKAAASLTKTSAWTVRTATELLAEQKGEPCLE